MFRVTLPPVLALGLMAGLPAPAAQAADYLRGAYAGETAPRQVAGPDWGGFYVGAFAGITSLQSKPGALGAPSVPTTAYPAAYSGLMPAATTAFPNASKNGAGFGGFAGANYLWDDVVLGIEADYSHGNLKADSRVGPVTRQSAASNPQYVLTNTQDLKTRLNDWGTLRGRVGYATGMFMPYLSLGVAMGNLKSTGSNYGTWTEYNTTTGAVVATGTYNATGGKSGIAFGAAFGAGIEAQIVPNTFLRAEWQGVQFATPSGRRDIKDVMLHTARVGGGVKF